MTIEANKSWKFLAMWDIYGLESLINITEREQENLVSVLKGEKLKHTNPMHHMILRAQFNPQRHYEIYVFESEIDEVSIKETFRDNPQFIVDLIRERGNKVYSDRQTRDALIT